MGSALGAQRTWDFTTDPRTGADALTIGGNGINIYEWNATGGNPGGFLGVTYPVGGQVTIVSFPNIDPGKVVTAFKFEADLRVGNSTGDRAADGFSVSFAREGDPALSPDNINSGNQGVFAGGIAEGGSTTGIAVSFDTWSGNTLPDGPDIEGIIVRVDNKTVNRTALPTRHGACADNTSLQTGPRSPQYWADNGTGDDAWSAPGSWAELCWQPFSIELDEAGKLTVKWKGRTILNQFQTTYFPTASQLVMAGRTGGANQHTHFDNIKLTTVAASIACVPNAPTNVRAAEQGASRVLLTWDPAILPCDPTGKVAYEIERDGVVIAALVAEPRYEDRNVSPSKTYQYKITGKNIAGQKGTAATLGATTVALVDSVGFVQGKIYDGITGTAVDLLFESEKYPASPDRVVTLDGISFGQPSFGGTYGDNYGIQIEGTVIPPATGQYRFFIRSDDASRLYINTSGAAIPDPTTATAVAEETGCCGAFQAPGDPRTSEPISLTAGQRYGFAYLVKEGGGGDWGQVAWRLASDTTVPPTTEWIRGANVAGKADPVGSSITITAQPASVSVPAFKSVTFSVAAEIVSPYTTTPVYQWYKNGAAIPGATSASYSIPVVQSGDNGAKYKAVVIVPGKTQDSAEATLTVTANVAPTIVSVTGSDSFTRATVQFDQPVVAPSATTAANYALSGGVTVSAAALVDQFTVNLTTSTQTPGASYTLTVNNVQNIGNTPVAPNSTATFKAWDLIGGRARAEQYTGFPGATDGDIDTVLADAKWPNSPDVVRFVNGLSYGEPNFGDTWGDNHMVAIKAILRPTESGQYRFHVRSDDASRLYLNTSGAAIPDPRTATIIAQETGCCTAYLEAPEESVSEPINLTAGQSYGVIYLIKEGGGGDWGQVGWRRVGTTGPVQTIVSQAFWYGPAPAPAALAVARDGANLRITYGGTLQSADSIVGPWADVAGATSPYSTPASASQRFYRSRN
jgi:hypothetical protein